LRLPAVVTLRVVPERPSLKDPDAEPGSEERLLVEAAQRDPSRFAELYERHFDRVYAFVLRRVPERAEAEDLTSDVFQRALADLPRFEWRGAPFAAWLFRIAANAIANHFEKSRRLAPPIEGAPEPIVMREIEHRTGLYRSVEKLPVLQRRVIRLRFGEEKSIREIARDIGKSEGAVKQLQLRALKNLRARMGGIHG
jgi:RNA polymerase sigma-70 factor (ECF subfamily)